MTHFSDADNPNLPTKNQMAIFNETVEYLGRTRLANSAGIIAFQNHMLIMCDQD